MTTWSLVLKISTCSITDIGKYCIDIFVMLKTKVLEFLVLFCGWDKES